MQVHARALDGLLYMLVLGVLADGPLHGYAVVAALQESGGDVIAVTDRSVYPALQRLEHQGLVRSSWSVVDGRSRRNYELTPAGREKLGADRKVWGEFVAAVGALIGTQDSGRR
jgi:DNA-binding PadR family transcriptional regulator